MSHTSHTVGDAPKLSGERGISVSRPGCVDGPIAWGKVTRRAGSKHRQGTGRSGLVYHVCQEGAWQVAVETPRTHRVIGSAIMQDHALGLALMWEQSVLRGRIDMS